MKHLFFILMAIVMLSSACSESFNDQANVAVDAAQQEQVVSHWGNKEPIPYSVENMRRALIELQNDGLSKSAIPIEDIQATHVYVKFMPKDNDEYMLLKSDSVLDIVPIPYDNDLSNFNGIYRDPSVPVGQPTYQYSVVEVGYQFPDVEYVVLDSVYMPDMVSSKLSKKSFDSELWEQLERTAIEMTGFDYERSLSKATKREGVVYSSNNRPVPDVKVYVNFSVRKDAAQTNSKGEYSMKKEFSCQVHTHVYFENSNFTIYDYETKDLCAYYAGRYSGYALINIEKDKRFQNMASMVALGVYKLCNENVERLLTPPYCDVFLYPSSMFNDGDCQGYYKWDAQKDKPYIQIADNPKNLYYTFECSVNQFSKAALHSWMGRDYYKLAFELCDAWGLGVGWRFTVKEFGKYELRNTKPFYNNLIVDLIDDDNSLHDKVKGYSLNQIEHCLRVSTSISNFRDNLINTYDNTTEQYLDDLFLFWFNY